MHIRLHYDVEIIASSKWDDLIVNPTGDFWVPFDFFVEIILLRLLFFRPK